jgi:arylsulfatase A-like enzyme
MSRTAAARDIHDPAAPYDGEIAFVDEQFGRLLDELREPGLCDWTLIVPTADHGEEFHEHGTWTHSNNLFTQTTQVPLLIKRALGYLP